MNGQLWQKIVALIVDNNYPGPREQILFGFPVMITKIDKKSYDKKSIISTVEKNFKLNKKRNRWDKNSMLHHSYNDMANPKYHRVNFDTLIPVYKKTLLTLFNRMDLRGGYQFDFRIVNYTCLANSNYMKAHIHPGVDFTAVHYIQFDSKHHTPTVFENHLPHADYISGLRPELTKILSIKHLSNSWAYDAWALDVQEDDFCFSPSFIRHRIDPQTSRKKNRITIVLNISLKRKT